MRASRKEELKERRRRKEGNDVSLSSFIYFPSLFSAWTHKGAEELMYSSLLISDIRSPPPTSGGRAVDEKRGHSEGGPREEREASSRKVQAAAKMRVSTMGKMMRRGSRRAIRSHRDEK